MTQQILEQALRLTESERAEIAAELLDSLDSQSDDGAERLWQEEIERRIAVLDAGVAVTAPWSEVREKLWGRLDEPA